MLDFFDFSTPDSTGHPSDVVPLYACSTSSRDGEGSVAITSDAVYLGEAGAVTLVHSRDIRSWRSSSRGPLFALTVETEETHVTYLFSELRSATVRAMTRVIGPEGVLLRTA